MPTTNLSLLDLARSAGVTPRTVRYYIAQGLLSGPTVAGPASHYTDGHLARLRLIRQLQREHLPLAEIRGRLVDLSDSDVRDLVATPRSNDAPDSALEYVRSILAGGTTRRPTDATGGLASARTWAVAGPGAGSRTGDRRSTARSTADDDLRPRAVAESSSAEPAEAVPAKPAPPEAALGGAHPIAAAPSAPHPGHQVRAVSARFTAFTPPAGQSAGGAQIPSGPAHSALRSSAAPARSQWDRLALTADIELHIRRPLSRDQNRRVERLIALARDLFEEEE